MFSAGAMVVLLADMLAYNIAPRVLLQQQHAAGLCTALISRFVVSMAVSLNWYPFQHMTSCVSCEVVGVQGDD